MIYASSQILMRFSGLLSCNDHKMAVTERKADKHLRLVQIKLGKIVCKFLNYLIHVMLSYPHAREKDFSHDFC